MTQGSRKNHMDFVKVMVFCFFILFSSSAWSRVFLQWSNSALPPAKSLGISDIVFSSKGGVPPSLVVTARKQGYRLYAETTLQEATAAAKVGAKAGWTGIILDGPESKSTEFQNSVANLRTAYPNLRFLVLNRNGKQPDMRGSLVIKKDSVLEVSSPTAQPWIDSNLALIKVERRPQPAQIPLYTFSWDVSDGRQQPTLTAADYSLAVAEAGAFHADLVLQLDEHLQRTLSNHDAEAWALWNQVRPIVKFYSDETDTKLEAAANVALVVDHLDTNDEVANLLARHNIPFQVLLSANFKTADLEAFNVLVMFAKPDEIIGQRIAALANQGKTVVIVGGHGSYPWQSSQPDQLNEHTVSYAVGNGKVLELSEPVADPETFAQDIRRLLGKRDALLSLWNGLTTIAVPYKDREGTLKVIEFVNYAAEPLRVQVQVKGSFTSVRYESPEHGCCETLVPVKHDGFTEFVIPELRVGGRVHLDAR